MTLTIIFVIAALTPLLIEYFVDTGPGLEKRLSPLFYVLAPVIGIMSQLGFLALVGYPIVAAIWNLTIYVLITVISNMKRDVLRMVYAAQDSENIRHFFLYPSFYFVHFGWHNVGLLFLFVTGTLLGISQFDTLALLPIDMLPVWQAWIIGMMAWYGLYRLLLMIAASILTKARATKLGLDRGANVDSARYGLFPTIFLHSVRLQRRERLRALAFAHARPIDAPSADDAPYAKPDIIALQGESFIDLGWVDGLFDKDAANWAPLERLRQDGVVTGQLDVPCWGAYTMQTEMAVLTGIPPEAYGVAQLNPYQALTSRQRVWSITAALKAQGYRTVCLHPAKKGFFRRHKAIPNLGFDEFIGLESFSTSPRYGIYVSDEAMVEKIEALLAESDQPLYIHAISIESHGPWVPGRLADVTDEEALFASELTGDKEFALYRRHMERLVDAFDRLRSGEGPRGRVTAMFGDHQPAMGTLFDQTDFNNGPIGIDVGYCLYNSAWKHGKQPDFAQGTRRVAQEFGFDMLREAGFRVAARRPIEDR